MHREVLEETGLHVKNLRFYKSQPWTFTDTLLFGFFAELDGSDKITVQEDELAEAGWFHRSEIPEDQSRISLTGEMMNENEREKKQIEPANDAEAQKQAQIDQRRRMIQMLAGTYLLYLAYQLISSAVQEAAWSTMKIVSLIAGVIFGLTGAALLIFNVRAELKRAKEMAKPKEKEQGEDER